MPGRDTSREKPRRNIVAAMWWVRWSGTRSCWQVLMSGARCRSRNFSWGSGRRSKPTARKCYQRSAAWEQGAGERRRAVAVARSRACAETRQATREALAVRSMAAADGWTTTKKKEKKRLKNDFITTGLHGDLTNMIFVLTMLWHLQLQRRLIWKTQLSTKV